MDTIKIIIICFNSENFIVIHRKPEANFELAC